MVAEGTKASLRRSQRQCGACGAIFETARATQVFCSASCRAAKWTQRHSEIPIGKFMGFEIIARRIKRL